MRKRFITMKLGLVCGLAMVASEAVAEVNASVVAAQVVAEGHESEGGENGLNSLRPFNQEPGSTVAFFLKSPDKAIISLDSDQSKVRSFQDDQGTDLTAVKRKFNRGGVSFGFPRASEDGKVMLVEVSAGGVPKAGSKQIVAKGEFVVSVASKSKLTKSKPVAVKKGATFLVGNKEFKITEAGKPKWGDDPFSITLKSSVDHESCKAFKFYGPQGKEIEASQSSSGSMGIFGKKTYTVTHSLKEKAKQMALGVDEWTDLEVIKVPFDVKIGAGF